MTQEDNIPIRTAGIRAAILAASLGALSTIAGSAGAQEAPAAAMTAKAAQPQIVEVEAALERLATLEGEWHERDKGEETDATARLEEVTALEAQLAEAEARSDAANAVFDRSKELVRDGVADLREALGRAEAPSDVPEPRHGAQRLDAFSASDRPVSGTEAERLEELEEQLEDKTLELQVREIELREASIDRHGAYAGRLWELRLAALEVLPAERGERLSSLTRERWAEIRFDFDILRLVVELQWFRLRLLVYSLPLLVRDVFAAATVGSALFRVLLVLLLWRWIQGRRSRLLERLRQRTAGLGRVRMVAELIEAAAPWGIFLLALLALHWALGPEFRALPFFGLLFFVLVAIYGAYRLVSDLAVAVLVTGAEHTAFEMTDGRRARIDRSVRWVLRVALVMFLLPAAYRYRLEGGVLHAALREVGLWRCSPPRWWRLRRGTGSSRTPAWRCAPPAAGRVSSGAAVSVSSGTCWRPCPSCGSPDAACGPSGTTSPRVTRERGWPLPTWHGGGSRKRLRSAATLISIRTACPRASPRPSTSGCAPATPRCSSRSRVSTTPAAR